MHFHPLLRAVIVITRYEGRKKGRQRPCSFVYLLSLSLLHAAASSHSHPISAFLPSFSTRARGPDPSDKKCLLCSVMCDGGADDGRFLSSFLYFLPSAFMRQMCDGYKAAALAPSRYRPSSYVKNFRVLAHAIYSFIVGS